MTGLSEDYVVGIIHYRQPEMVRRLVQAITTWTVQPRKIIVMDNSGDFVEVPGDDALLVIDMGYNAGYAAAANAALSYARTHDHPACLILTQDARLAGDAAELLRNHLVKTVDVAVAAPVLCFNSRPQTIFSAGGTLSRRAVPQHIDLWRDAASLGILGNNDVDWADGACLMINTAKANLVRNFPECYFLYVEEIDFQARLRHLGYRVSIVNGARGQQEPGRRTPYLKYRNLLFFSRHAEAYSLWPFWIEFPADLLRWFKGREFSAPAWAVRGLFDASVGRMGPPPATLWTK